MSKANLDGMIELDEVLAKAKANTAKFIAHLENEEAGERVETVDSIQNQITADKSNTIRKKKQFISEIKGSLGDEIKESGGRGVTIVKPTLIERIKRALIKIYSKF